MQKLGSKLLVTERLELRPQTMQEQKYLWEVLMLKEVNQYFLTVPKKYRDKLQDWSKQEPFYIEEMKHANDNDIYKWSIFLKDTDICIGRISCHECEDENVTNPAIRDIGWLIAPPYQRNGYAKEAATAMLNYMFDEVEIEKIITGAAIINPASWKIMEYLNFKRQPYTKLVNYTFQDNPIEAYVYKIDKNEYHKK